MPQFMNTTKGRVLRDIIAHVHADALIGQKLKNGEIRKKLTEPQWKVPEGYQLDVITMEHFCQ